MPTGVASHFIQVVGRDLQAAKRRLVVAVVLALALAAGAWWLWPVLGLAVHFGALLVGALVAWLLARRTTRAYEKSMRGGWGEWMRYAVAADSIPAIHRRVDGQSDHHRPYWMAAGLTAVWAIEFLLLILALADDAEVYVSIPVIAANGILAGAILGSAIHGATWYRGLRDSVVDLVKSGEIGVWGVL